MIDAWALKCQLRSWLELACTVGLLCCLCQHQLVHTAVTVRHWMSETPSHTWPCPLPHANWYVIVGDT